MDKSEPALAPEWLRSTGNASGGGSSVHPFASSSPHSDRTSANSRRNLSNGSSKHPYSSFSRSHRDKDRERDKERLSYGDHWDHDSSDPLGSMLSSRAGKDTLRRSHSMVSRKPSDYFPHRAVSDQKNWGGNNHTNGNGLISNANIGNSTQKAVFEKDFPSLSIGGEERQVPDIARVSSPVLSTAVQSLPAGSSALVSGEGWTSALAEVPVVIGSNTNGSLSNSLTVAATASSGIGGLNMAEALIQAPSRTKTAPQLSFQTQRREELAIKKSKQLIPVTPSMPKSSILNSSEKAKPRITARSGEMNMVFKTVQQQPPSVHTAKPTPLVGTVKPETPKTSHGKLFILKPGRENGASHSLKDVASPTNNTGRATNSQVVASSTPTVSLRSSNNPKLLPADQKSTNLNLVSGLNVEKRPLSQSRLDFFNDLKKKTSGNGISDHPDPSVALSSPTSKTSSKENEEVVNTPASLQAINNGVELSVNGGTFEEVHMFTEQEIKFLRELGWDEKGGDDGGGYLTQEEIIGFCKECSGKSISVKAFRVIEQKLLESHATGLDAPSYPASSSSDSGSET